MKEPYRPSPRPADGQWTSIPIQVRVCWEGAPLDEVGYRLGEEIMVPQPLIKTGRKVLALNGGGPEGLGTEPQQMWLSQALS